jgi:DNA-binding transcriptional MocR family regulator
LSRRLAAAGIEAPLEQIMLTESGTHAIDLICRFLLQPGDTVLVDDPCYFNFHALLKAHRVNIVGVPYTATGPDIEAFGAALREHAPRLYITNSGIHNPTGATLSPVTAHRLLKLADTSSLVIVEDDIFGDFENTPAPRLSAFDGLARVIQIGSFSKTISASIRCGYIASRREWIESLVDLKIATTFGGGRMAADIVHQAITDSGYRKHMEGVRFRLAQEMGKTVARLQAIGIKPWMVPQAGMYLWCQLPQGKDAATLARACLKEAVVLAPGNAFSQSMTAGDFLRFNVAQSGDSKIYEVLKRALNA